MKFVLVVILASVLWLQSSAAAGRLNLVIFSGQSNMVSFDPEADQFLPTVRAAFPNDEWIHVKHAQNGQRIGEWVSVNYDAEGKLDPIPRSYYKKIRLLTDAALDDGQGGKRTPDTVTFVWMQGEADANQAKGATYEQSLHSLMHLLQKDYSPDVNFVLGRLSDFTGYSGENRWETVKQAQMDFAAKHARAVWVDTDDLNGPKDDLHYPTDQQPILGQRWANATIALVPEPSALLPATGFFAIAAGRPGRHRSTP